MKMNGKLYTQTQMVKDHIIVCLDDGLTNKQDIYDKVVRDTGVARSVVRRVARDIRIELSESIKLSKNDEQSRRLKILQLQFTKRGKNWVRY